MALEWPPEGLDLAALGGKLSRADKGLRTGAIVKKLGRLEKVDIREIWEHEALEFTPWLADHLTELGAELLVDFDDEDVEKEVSVGDFNIDIVTQDSDGRTVIIENQLERTDHDHLGKCITYAAGKGASTIIWVVKDARQEHRKAIEWLNIVSSDDVRFFLVQIEAWRIGDSDPAPRFNVVESPNDWAKTVSRTPTQDTPLKLGQQEFWVDVVSYGKEHAQHVKSWWSPPPRPWFHLTIGVKAAHLALSVDSRKRNVAVMLYIDNGDKDDNKSFFDALHKDRISIEETLGKLDWYRLDEKKSCIIARTKNLDYQSDKDRMIAVQWLVEMADRFVEVFTPYGRRQLAG